MDAAAASDAAAPASDGAALANDAADGDIEPVNSNSGGDGDDEVFFCARVCVNVHRRSCTDLGLKWRIGEHERGVPGDRKRDAAHHRLLGTR